MAVCRAADLDADAQLVINRRLHAVRVQVFGVGDVLSDLEKDVLRLTVYQDLSARVAGKRLRISVKSVENAKWNATDKLREHIRATTTLHDEEIIERHVLHFDPDSGMRVARPRND